MKNQRIVKHMALLALAAAALIVPKLATAGNWSVNSLSDLIAAMNAANQAGGANTITLARGMTFTLSAVNNTTNGPTGLPVIAANNKLTILGNGATLARSTAPGTPAFRLFAVASGASLTLENLTLANGMILAPARMNGFGGGVLNKAGGTLTVSQTTFVSNQTVGGDGRRQAGGWGFGGAIYNDGTASLDRVVFRGNRAFGGATTHGRNSGGYGFAGAVANGNAGNLTVSQCSFTGNQAIGGLRHKPSAEFDGIAGSGAIDNQGTASITDSMFTDNEAIGGAADPGVNGGYSVGGALGSGGPAAYNPVCRIERCTFNRNLAIGADAGSPGNVDGAGIGGALSNGYAQNASTMAITDCSFTANQALGGNGGFGGGGVAGALNVESPLSLTITLTTIANSTFTDNKAIGGGLGGYGAGGAIRNADLNTDDGSGATLAISNCTFTGNQALGASGGDGVNAFAFAAGGAVSTSGNTTILNSTLKDNRAVGGALLPGGMPSFDTASSGGGLNCWGGTLYVRDSSFVGNQVIGCAGSAGGAGSAAMGGGIEVDNGYPAAIIHCWLVDNAAVGGAGGSGAFGGPGVGGGLDVDLVPAATAVGPSTTVTITDTTISRNQAIGGDGDSQGLGGGYAVRTGIFFGIPDTSSVTLDAGSRVDHNEPDNAFSF